MSQVYIVLIAFFVAALNAIGYGEQFGILTFWLVIIAGELMVMNESR